MGVSSAIIARSEAVRSEMPVNKVAHGVHGSSNEVWEFPGKGFVRRGQLQVYLQRSHPDTRPNNASRRQITRRACIEAIECLPNMPVSRQQIIIRVFRKYSHSLGPEELEYLDEVLKEHEISDEDVEMSIELLAKEYNKQDGSSVGVLSAL